MKLLILDRDGTLTTPASGGEFSRHPKDLILLPGVKEKIQEAVDDGWTIAIVHNQSQRWPDVIDPTTGRPYTKLDYDIEEMRHTLDLLPEVSRGLFCPSLDGFDFFQLMRTPDGIDVYNRSLCSAECADMISFRKPGPGMLLWLLKGCTPDEVLMIGDRPEDEAAAKAAKVRFVWAHDWRVGWTKEIGF